MYVKVDFNIQFSRVIQCTTITILDAVNAKHSDVLGPYCHIWIFKARLSLVGYLALKRFIGFTVPFRRFSAAQRTKPKEEKYFLMNG